MKNLQTLANELATNKTNTLTTNDLQTIKGGCFSSRALTKSYSCSSSKSYSCGVKSTNNSCNSSHGNGNGNNGNGRGNGGGEA